MENDLITKENSLEKYGTKETVDTLHSMMKTIAKSKLSSETVNAACNCAGKITDILKVHLDYERLKIQLHRLKWENLLLKKKMK